MSTEQNTAFVRRYWEEVWNNGYLAVVDASTGIRCPANPTLVAIPQGRNNSLGCIVQPFPIST